MNKEAMLLNAARAMGFEVIDKIISESDPEINSLDVFDKDTGARKWWNPLESSADCAEMEDALDIAHHRYGSPVVHIRAYSMDLLSSNLLAFSEFGNKGAARRYASTMVAAMIGSKL